MARDIYLVILLTIVAAPSLAKTENHGKVSIFRWNQGYRAETTPVFEGKIPESQFRSMVREGKLPDSPEIYAGCYMAHFEWEKIARKVASEKVTQPKSEVFRICQ